MCGCGVCWNDCVASGYDIASSLPLQVALYWNAIYAVFYVLFGGIVCVYKVSSLPKCERRTTLTHMCDRAQLNTYETKLEWVIVPPCLFFVFACLEYLRIRLGYSGNLRGKVLYTVLHRLPPGLQSFTLLCAWPGTGAVGVYPSDLLPSAPHRDCAGRYPGASAAHRNHHEHAIRCTFGALRLCLVRAAGLCVHRMFTAADSGNVPELQGGTGTHCDTNRSVLPPLPARRGGGRRTKPYAGAEPVATPSLMWLPQVDKFRRRCATFNVNL